MSLGKDITSLDNNKLFLNANDEIRGVETICYGDCPSGQCFEESITFHGVEWLPPNECVNGGVVRSSNTYTNLNVSGFKTEIGYSGHFYGARKYDGLIPFAPYYIIVNGQTGSNVPISFPREFDEVGYGSNDYVAYSGIKFTPSNLLRQAGDQYGKSVAVRKNVIAIGSPMRTIEYQGYDIDGDPTTFNLEETGAVYVYSREDRPSGTWPIDKDSSPWSFDSIVTLPSSILKDYYIESKSNKIGETVLPLELTYRNWEVGQEGRQFGHSVALSVTSDLPPSFQESDRKILVVGAPSAKWSGRIFEELQASGVQIGLLVFTDEFESSYLLKDENGDVIVDINKIPIRRDSNTVFDVIKDKDLIFKYFSNPPVKFNVKIMVCEPISSLSTMPDYNFDEPKPENLFKKRIARKQGFYNESQNELILSGIKSIFHEAFPYDQTKLNNNIPPILGFCVDDTFSLGREAVTPAIDEFIKYYQQYSFASGLVDFYGTRCSGAYAEFKPSGTESWIDTSIQSLNYILDTGRILKDDQVRFLTSGIGPEAFNNDLSVFNYPPSSGGSVFIFERESGVWNLIQEIKSSVRSSTEHDRFGHSVSISKNSEVITIGSPYANETCVALEYKPQEKNRLFSQLPQWLGYKSSVTGGNNPRYTSLIAQYEYFLNIFSLDYCNKILYSKLTHDEKFEARKYLNIREYQTVYSYNGAIGQLQQTGDGWEFIVNMFAPTSRLGYSTAVNEDGSIIAFGAPTDSFNISDDPRVYYKNLGYYNPASTEINTGLIQSSWSSNVNAGAVRVFESRKIYPHNKVIEYGKFGNLQQDVNNPLDSGHFGYLASIFRDKNFEKTSFSETDIPIDAGLVFIITPAIDALSDEISDKIINWLSLGDRNLVLVGNDPVWEDDGLYAKSNEIINKILRRLDSRMKLHPARNMTEASVHGCGKAIECFKPQNSISTNILPLEMSVYGTADIRTNFDSIPSWRDLYITMPCSPSKDPLLEALAMDDAEADVLNTACQLPLKNNGDLRAEWKDQCIQTDCDLKYTQFPINYPYLFNVFDPPCCDPNSAPLKDKVIKIGQFPPVPLLASVGSFVEIIDIPASPATSGSRPKYKEQIIPKSTTRTFIDTDHPVSGIQFYWTSSGNNYLSLDLNSSKTISEELFYVPEPFEERQALIQAKAIPFQNVVVSKRGVVVSGYFAAQEDFPSNSKLITIASTDPETQANIYLGDDRNVNFYVNLVSKPNQRGGSKIAQLGGWTGRTSFKDANQGSLLHEVFVNNSNEVTLNVTKLSSSDDVCWIADPINLPQEEELQSLKNWMSLPNKKVVVTYGKSESSVRIAKSLFSLLGSKLEPIYLLSEERFASITYFISDLRLNPNHFVSYGPSAKYSISNMLGRDINFVPIQMKTGIVPIATASFTTYVNDINTAGYWKMNTGTCTVRFPAIAGSGYRVFIDTVAESPAELTDIKLVISNASQKIEFPPQSGKLEVLGNLSNRSTNNVITQSFDIQVDGQKNYIDFNFNNESDRLPIETSSYIPKTIRIVSISGVMFPLVTEKTFEETTIKIFDGYETFEKEPARPARSISTERYDFFSNLNNQYCSSNECISTLGNQYIPDGPVVVAQEIEHLSSFNAGIARSRITLLADSSLVQGRCMGDDNFRTTANAISFIRSLYPDTQFPTTNNGRSFIIQNKIISPERSSPQKLYALTGNSGTNMLFNGGFNIAQPSTMRFTGVDSIYDPKYVKSPEKLYTADEEKSQIEKERKFRKVLKEFTDLFFTHGGCPRFSGIIEGKMYTDAGISGGMPQLMKDTGYDYLDFERFPSGYPGDLFGYSISLHNNKLVVGAPFAAYSDQEPRSWSYFFNGGQSAINASVRSGFNGGAGSVYLFEKTYTGDGFHGSNSDWEFIQKLRPSSINIGQDLLDNVSSLPDEILGSNSYSDPYLTSNSIITDKFGISVSMDSDVIIVGAPGHDFGRLSIDGSGSFIRKCFNGQFNIPSREIIDFATSGSRLAYPSSGVVVLNNGAIFAFENSIVDWNNKTQEWTLIEKIVPQGNKAREQDYSEDDNFGRSVSLDRSFRTDADYTIVGGAFKHKYDTNGDNELNDAGSSYTYDVMLREQIPAIPSPLTSIDAKVFGEGNAFSAATIRLLIQNNGQNRANHYSSGIVYADENGQIFIEASGQDPAPRGFIDHRPYIVSIQGNYLAGTDNSGSLGLFIRNENKLDNNVNLFTNVDDSANVYNNVGLYTGAVIGFASGDPNGLNLYLSCRNPVEVSESGLCLFTASGIGSSTDSLNLRIRGK